MTYPIILWLLSFSLSFFFLSLFSAGSSLPTERSSCMLVLLRRQKTGSKYGSWLVMSYGGVCGWWRLLGVEMRCVRVDDGGGYGGEVCEGG